VLLKNLSPRRAIDCSSCSVERILEIGQDSRFDKVLAVVRQHLFFETPHIWLENHGQRQTAASLDLHRTAALSPQQRRHDVDKVRCGIRRIAHIAAIPRESDSGLSISSGESTEIVTGLAQYYRLYPINLSFSLSVPADCVNLS